MVIKRFNESFEDIFDNWLKNNPDFGYSQKIERDIKHFNSDQNKIRYHISTADDKHPEQRSFNTTLEQALMRMEELNSAFTFDHPYCVYEAKIKALTKEDIEIYLNAKKYNL